MKKEKLAGFLRRMVGVTLMLVILIWGGLVAGSLVLFRPQVTAFVESLQAAQDPSIDAPPVTSVPIIEITVEPTPTE